MIADISFLDGNSFVAKSGNSAAISVLGKGGLYVRWKNDPTVEDCEEFNDWVAKLLGDANVTLHRAGKASEGALEKAKAAYKLWREKLPGG